MIFTNIIETIFQKNIYIVILVGIMFLLVMNYSSPTIAITMLIVFYIIVNYKELFTTLKDIEKNSHTKERIIEENFRKEKELQWNPEIEEILHKLKRFKKYNPNSYEDGYYFMKMYTYTINDLENDKITNHNHYFDKLYMYYKQSINNFQSISVSVPEESTYDALKYNRLTTMKIASRISDLCKRLQKICYTEIFNLSLRLDENWKQNPTIHTKGIHMNPQEIEEYSKDFDYRWSLY